MKDYRELQYGILFDYNGVIADDELVHEIAFGQTLKSMGLELTANTYQNCCLGRTDADGFRELSELFGAPLRQMSISDLVEQKGKHYQHLVADIDIFYPGVIDTIEILAKHFRLAIVTSSQRADIDAALQSTSIPRLVEFILTAEDVTHGKPNPQGYLIGANRLSLPLNRIAVVEDSASGVAAAVAAGLCCIAVKQTTEVERLHHADIIVDNTTDITPKMVKGLFVGLENIND